MVEKGCSTQFFIVVSCSLAEDKHGQNIRNIILCMQELAIKRFPLSLGTKALGYEYPTWLCYQLVCLLRSQIGNGPPQSSPGPAKIWKIG